MSIPSLQVNGELPEGEHATTLDEIEAVYGLQNDRRRLLMKGLRDAAQQFYKAGVRKLWVNGSFVTNKEKPNDIDGCWEYSPAVDHTALDPVFLAHSREAMLVKYGLDFFIANYTEAGSGLPFPIFFQVNREGQPKGILVVDLGETYDNQ